MRIEIFPRRTLLGQKRWYFRVKANNGEIIATSEGYHNLADARKTAHLLRDGMGQAQLFGAVA